MTMWDPMFQENGKKRRWKKIFEQAVVKKINEHLTLKKNDEEHNMAHYNQIT